VAPTHTTRDKENMATLKNTIPSCNTRREMRRRRNTRKWCEYHKIPWHNSEECHSNQSLVAEMKASKSGVDSDYESNPKGGN
jgi:hypothetical protein